MEKSFSLSDFFEIKELAHLSSRRRANHNMHGGFDDRIQYFINYICQDSYIVPHAHYKKSGDEILVPLSGSGCLVVFDDGGKVIKRELLKPIANSTDPMCKGISVVKPEIWHTVVPLQGDFCLLEIKSGPFEARFAKQLAQWAPREESVNASRFLESLVTDARLHFSERT